MLEQMMPNRRLRHWARRWVPRGLLDLLNRLGGHAISYHGDYPDWSSAEKVATGYDDQALFERVRAAALMVKQGQAAAERDGATFDEIPYPFALIACLARVSMDQGGRLSVLDFGGALGSSFTQCREFLAGIPDLRWSVVEQPHFVDFGRVELADRHLRFYPSIEACLEKEQPNVVLLSSVLQYLDAPYRLLASLAALPIDYLVIDRHPCSFDRERITIQRVPASLYRASYPSWLFDCPKMRRILDRDFELLAHFKASDPPIRGYRFGASFHGYFWRRRRPE